MAGKTPRHPAGAVIEIVGISAGDQGRSCEEHPICGEVVKEDMVLRLRKVQILVGDVEETAIAAYSVWDGVDRCRVGFLPRHAVYHHPIYDGKLVQVTDVYCAQDKLSATKRRKVHRNKGCCLASIISEETVQHDEEDEILSSEGAAAKSATVREGAGTTTAKRQKGNSADEASFVCVNKVTFQSMSPSKRQKFFE